MRTLRFREIKQQSYLVSGKKEVNKGKNQNSNPSQSDSKMQVQPCRNVDIKNNTTPENTNIGS